MSRQLLSDAFDQAQHAGPDVRAAAYLHIARVLNQFDPSKARNLVEQAIAMVEVMRDDRSRPMRFAAVTLAATVLPDVSLRLISSGWAEETHPGSALMMALFNMMSHGHRAIAVAFFAEPFDGPAYPFDAATNAFGPETREEDRARILRGAVNALRRQVANAASGSDPFQGAHGFPQLFSYHWRVLPADEARATVRDIATWIMSAPDRRITSGFGGRPDDPRFSSSRASWLYQFLGPLQHLDPDLTRSLAADNPELAKAVARYPYGMESMIKEMEASAPPTPPRTESLESDAVAPQAACFYLGHKMVTAAEAIAADYRSQFEDALALFAADTATDAPNEAPSECWPSTYEFRSILHTAGVIEGLSATRLLDRVPAGDCRLLASIELAAALAGLPTIGGRTMPPRPRRDRVPPPTERPPELPPGWPPKPFEPLPPARRPKRPASFTVQIAPTTKAPDERASGGCGSDFWTIEGARLKPVIARLYDVPETRVDLPASVPPGRFDFVLVLPSDSTQEAMVRLMQSGIQKHFRLTITRELRTMEAIVLTAPDGIKAAPKRESFGGGMGSGHISWTSRDSDPMAESDEIDLDAIFDMEIVAREKPFSAEDHLRAMMKRFARLNMGGGSKGVLTGISQAMTMAELCETLESSLARPVLDETGLAGTYALKIDTEAQSTEEFLRALADRLGLVTTAATREVPMVVVLPVY